MESEISMNLEDSKDVFNVESQEVQILLPTPLKKTRKRKVHEGKLRRSPRILKQPPEFSGIPDTPRQKKRKFENPPEENPLDLNEIEPPPRQARIHQEVLNPILLSVLLSELFDEIQNIIG